MRTSTRMTLAAGLAVALGAAPLGAIFENWRWVWYAWAAVAAVVGSHLLARYLRLPAVLVPVAGAAGLLLYLTAVFGSEGALFGVIPTPESLRLLQDGLAEGMENVNEYATPVPVLTGLVLLTAAALGVTAIAVDLVAVTWRRPAASGLALLALYAVPTAVVLSGVPWILFAIAAVGFLVLLMVEGRDRLAHWGRPVGELAAPPVSRQPATSPRDEDGPAPLTGQRIGAAAIALAVFLPLLVPGMSGNLLNRLGQSGSGDSGTGVGGGLSEFAELRGELRRGNPVELMRVRYDGLERPELLRTKVLDQYRNNGFSVSSGRGTARQEVGDGQVLQGPYGQEVAPDSQFTADITLTDFYNDTALPTYFVPDRVEGSGGGWTWSPDRGTVTSSDRRGNFAYTVAGTLPPRDESVLRTARALTEEERTALPQTTTFLPPGLPERVGAIAQDVVRGQTTPFGRAKALNDYFTDPANGFQYAENTIEGSSGNVLLDFLTKKQGYCEQYASAMAVMLRTLDIPSRVVIGYTPGVRQDDGSYVVTTNDAHAWVEAYFAGVGWTYFDPTPLADGRTVAPEYAPRPEASSTADPSATATATGSAGPTGNQLPEEDLAAGDVDGGLADQGVVTPRRLLTAALVLAVLLVLLVPAAARLAARRRRLRTAGGSDAGDAARAAWDEVVGSAADYGVPVPASETPRGLARRLDRDLSLDAEASGGLRLLALAEERARYAPRAGVNGDLPAAVAAVRRGLRSHAGRRSRWLAALLPPSTIRAARRGSASRAATASSALNQLGERVRRPVTPRRRR